MMKSAGRIQPPHPPGRRMMAVLALLAGLAAPLIWGSLGAQTLAWATAASEFELRSTENTEPVSAEAGPLNAPATPPEATYPSALAPPKTSGPLLVRVRLDLHDINDLDDSAENFEFSGVLTLTWNDPRLAFDPDLEGVDEKIYTGNFQFDEISPGWYPQMVLINESGMYEKNWVVLRIQPDGTARLIETVNAIAESKLEMHRFPFDDQRLEAVFLVLGFDRDEVRLVADNGSADTDAAGLIKIPQWEVRMIRSAVQDVAAPYAGRSGLASAFVVSIDVKRQPFFLMRLVVFPLVLIVVLSFTVFWMDRSSLGDRISVSFIGILTAVAYLMVTSDQMPRIAYVTLIHGFLNLSMIIMVLTVVINLIVGALEQKGQLERALRIDHVCRWAFPAAYFSLVLLMTAIALIFY